MFPYEQVTLFEFHTSVFFTCYAWLAASSPCEADKGHLPHPAFLLPRARLAPRCALGRCLQSSQTFASSDCYFRLLSPPAQTSSLVSVCAWHSAWLGVAATKMCVDFPNCDLNSQALTFKILGALVIDSRWVSCPPWLDTKREIAGLWTFCF